MDEEIEHDSNAGDQIIPARNWLQRKPLDFIERCSSKDRREIIGQYKTLLYDKLTLHLCFFIDGKLQIFTPQSSISSMDERLLCLPREVIEFDADDPDNVKLRRPEQDMSIHELVLGMLQDEIHSGVLRSVQFMDFAFDEHVVFRRSQTARENGEYELRELEVAVMLSLESGTSLALNRTWTLPRVGRSPVYYNPDALPLSEKEVRHKEGLGEMGTTSVFNQAIIDALFGREREFRSWGVMKERHRVDFEWEKKLCARRISSAVLVWKAYMSHPASPAIYGLVAQEKESKGDIYVFLMDRHTHENNKAIKTISHDLVDGQGEMAYRVVGRLIVGDFTRTDCTSFSRWNDDLVGKILGEDARLKIRLVDLWHI